MAMLAEKKRREKWCLNPRGQAWSNDQTKFGQRLLEKMGWSAGQGLGANNQGPTEIVKVKKKDDNKGLGFKENGEEWMKTTTEFSKLLDQLGSSVEEDSGEQTDVATSLEDRSKKSKARVHYHKFTRGKDLSRYSEKDLASIIGPDMIKSKGVDKLDPDYTTNQVNKGSSEEYFKSKKKCKRNLSPSYDCEEKTHDDNVEGEAISNKGCKQSKKYKANSELPHEELLHSDVQVSCKKKKNRETAHNSENDKEENSDIIVEADKISKKKKRKMQNDIENSYVSPMEQAGHLEESCDNYSIVDIKKISKRRKKRCEDEITLSMENNANVIEDTTLENNKVAGNEKNSKKHKKKVQDDTQEEESIDNNETIDDEHISKKRKKKIQCENVVQDQVSTPKNNETIGAERMSKKNNKKLQHLNTLDEETIGNNETVSDKNMSKRNKKAVKDENMQDQGTTEAIEAISDKKHSKKKQKKIEYNSIPSKEQLNEDSNFLQIGAKQEKKKKKNKHSYDDSLPLESSLAIEQLEEQTLKRSKLDRKSKEGEIIASEVHDNVVLPEVCEGQYLSSSKSKKELKKEKKLAKEMNEESQNDETVNCEQASPIHLIKQTEECLEVLHRKTRLRKIKTPHNPARDMKYETEEFMSISRTDSKGEPGISLPAKVIEVKGNTEDSSGKINENTQIVTKIHVEPNEKDLSIAKHVVVHEYRLLTAKLEQLKIVQPKVKVVIKDQLTFPVATRQKIKTLYKSKHFKQLLPPNELAEVEGSVKKFVEEIKPSIDMMNAVLAMEEMTEVIAQQLMGKCADPNRSSAAHSEDKMTQSPDEIETLENMSKQLQLLLGTINSDVEKAKGTQDSPSSPSKRSTKETPAKEMSGENQVEGEAVQSHSGSLQTRIEAKLKMLAEQMKMLAEGKTSVYMRSKVKMSGRRGRPSGRRGRPSGRTGRPNMRGSVPQGGWGPLQFIGGEGTDHQGMSDFFHFENQGQFLRGGFGGRRGNFMVQRRGRPGFMGPGRPGFMGPGRPGFMGPGRPGFMGPGRPGFMGPGRPGLMGLGRPGFMRPGRPGFMGPGRGYFMGRRRGDFMGRGRGDFRGRGRSDFRPRGKIAQSNFDAKLYAEKCKALNKVPELAFNGVDMKTIPGYAANILSTASDDSTTSNNHTNTSELIRKSSKLVEVVQKKERSLEHKKQLSEPNIKVVMKEKK